ncbi:GntR family transcriptional regulator [Aeromicrobium sp.]|uniref:GntR family transcriptional regulator n=1 Tax=Aeromicrobium sp. TaxID=1871063 RepID=UPI003D6AD35D
MRVLGVDHRALGNKPRLSRTSDEPSHARIEKWLLGRIDAGRLLPDDKLPREEELAAALGVSRMTLRQALGSMESRGLLERRRGRAGGNIIRERQIECDLTGLPGFTEQMRRANVRAGARVIGVKRVRAGRAVAASLELGRNQDVFEIVRVRSARREPLALEETYLPAHLFAGLDRRPLTGSIYAIMRRDYDLAPHSAQEWLEPAVATHAHATLLDVEPGAALMLVTRTSFTASGVAVEHAFDRYRADRTRISLRTSVSTTVSAELTADAVG